MPRRLRQLFFVNLHFHQLASPLHAHLLSSSPLFGVCYSLSLFWGGAFPPSVRKYLPMLDFFAVLSASQRAGSTPVQWLGTTFLAQIPFLSSFSPWAAPPPPLNGRDPQTQPSGQTRGNSPLLPPRKHNKRPFVSARLVCPSQDDLLFPGSSPRSAVCAEHEAGGEIPKSQTLLGSVPT